MTDQVAPGSASAVLVMPPAGRVGLVGAVGPERADAVAELLLARALAWAETATAAVPLRGRPGETLATAAGRAFTGDDAGPLLIAWPDLPVWRPEHHSGARSDLADGCGLAVGPVFDGGFYLVALAAPIPALLDLPDGPDAMNRAFRAAHEAEVGVGLLRPERGLRNQSDVAAALADPLLDSELRGLLS